jgi:glycosyltransferase involved in cell wall biosynthesis
MTEAEIQTRIGDSYEVPNNVVRAVPAPLVTVRTSTYQHGPYIRECIEGILNQKTSFPFEYIIGEDFSTDGTREIVLEYAKRFPDRIRVFTADYNVGAKPNGRRCMRAARGKYIALCEGDDYWHNPLKLQKQVDLMEADQSISLVCSDVDVIIQKSGRRIKSVDKRTGTWMQDLSNMTESLLLRKVTPFTCTTLMRRADMIKVREKNPYEFSSEWPMGDLQHFIELSRLGRVVHIDESLATYRSLENSASRSTDPLKELRFIVKVHELSEHYIKKLQFSSEIANQTRLRYFHARMAITMKYNSEEIRQMCKQYLMDFPLNPVSWNDRWLLRIVNSSKPVSQAKVPYLLVSKAHTLLYRISTIKHRLKSWVQAR